MLYAAVALAFGCAWGADFGQQPAERYGYLQADAYSGYDELHGVSPRLRAGLTPVVVTLRQSLNVSIVLS